MSEVDHAGNPCCGEDFMAGTICSLPPNHDGPHGCTCQACGGDWMDETCECGKVQCQDCGRMFAEGDGHGVYCDYCMCEEEGIITNEHGDITLVTQCYLPACHPGNHRFTPLPDPANEEEVAAAIASIERDMPAVLIVLRECVDCGNLIGCLMGGDPPTCKTHN